MSNQKESTVRTLAVAIVVCLVCSVFVAGAAVALKSTQVENKELDKQRSILAIAGLGDADLSGKQVKALYKERIVAKVVDLESGTFSDAQDVNTFDPLKAAKTPNCPTPCRASRTSPRSSGVSVSPPFIWWKRMASSTP